MDKAEENREFKINFTPEDIVNKDFKHKYRGYDIAEIDPFLDRVIQDYEAYRSRIKFLEQENTRLVKKSDELSRQSGGTTNATSFNSVNNSSIQNTTNYDILRRLSNLERHVFGEQEAAKIATKPAASNSTTEGSNLNQDHPDTMINRF